MTELRGPWIEPDEQARRLEIQLQKETGAGHSLEKRSVTAIARRTDRDDVLFRLEDGRVAEVHLTWNPAPESNPKWPTTLIFSDFEEWAAARLLGEDSD